MKNILPVCLACLLLIISISCGGVKKVQQFKSYDEFLQKTRLVMLKKEIEIYGHLADEEEKEAFVKEFWEKRDPDPSTPENEAKDEFDKRIEYVSRWFCEGVGKNRCLNSDRGKVYILLGEPDERTTNRGNIIDRFGKPMRILKEIWIYNQHRLYLEFRDAEGLGEYRLLRWSTDLLRAIEESKFVIYQKDQFNDGFKFNADFRDNKIDIQIPVKGISFIERENNVIAKFEIVIHIYYNYKKNRVIDKTHDWSGSKSELLKKKNIGISIPNPLKVKGVYYFEIIIKDVNSLSKYRKIIKKKV